MSRKKIPPLPIEHVSDASNLHITSLLRYRDVNYLVIIDNITADEIHAYVLDACQTTKIDLKNFLTLAVTWFYKSSEMHPLSFEISKNGLTEILSPIYRTFDLCHVTRLVGAEFKYHFDEEPKIRRRRANFVKSPTDIKFHKFGKINRIELE